MTVIFGIVGESRHPQEDAILALAREASESPWKAVCTPDTSPSHAQITGDAAVVTATSLPVWGAASSSLTRQGKSWLACRGLICRRAELLRLLGHRPADAELSDAGLVWALYQKLGLACFEQLTGDWCAALWDAGRGELILAKDPTGNCAMFWWQDPAGRLLFSNHLPTLVAVPQVPKKPNAQWVAGLVAVFYDPLSPSHSAFEGVQALPPGQLLRWRQGQTTLYRWWRPEALGPLDAGDSKVLLDQFVGLYQEAVSERLARPRGGVAATLSGGLDSGSVVALAAPLVARQGLQLQAFVHVPQFEVPDQASGRTFNEWTLAQATARHAGSVRLMACPTHHITPVAAIDLWLNRMSVPSHATAHWFWGLDIMGQAKASKASVVLSGEGGNATVSYGGTGSLWGSVRHLRGAHVAREVRLEQGGAWRGVWNRLVKPLLRPAWHTLQRIQDDAIRLQGRPAWTDFGLLNMGFAERVQLLPRMRGARHDPGLRSFQPHRVAQWRAGQGVGDNTFAIGHSLGLSFGLEWRDPTKDRRLLEFCLRLPDVLFWFHGQQRGLIRHGMRDHLPHEVLHCTAKGLQSSDLQQRLVASSDELLAKVDEVVRHPTVREWFDVDRLWASAQQAVAGDTVGGIGVVSPPHLLRALAGAAFVARHS